MKNLAGNIKYLSFLTLISSIFLGTSCSEDYIPKPKGYNRIDLPEHEYKKLEKEDHSLKKKKN